MSRMKLYIKSQLAPAAVSRATTLAANEVGSMFSTWLATREMQGLLEAAMDDYNDFSCTKNVEKDWETGLKMMFVVVFLKMLSPKGLPIRIGGLAWVIM